MGKPDILLFVWRLLWAVQAKQVAAHVGRRRPNGASQPSLTVVRCIVVGDAWADGAVFVDFASAFRTLGAYRIGAVFCSIRRHHHAGGMVVLPCLQHHRNCVVRADRVVGVDLAAHAAPNLSLNQRPR